MSKCDDLFQQIQALEQRRREIETGYSILENSQRSADEPDPARNFVLRDKGTGQELETNFDEMWKGLANDPDAYQGWAARAAGERSKPIGANGEFENFAQLVDRMGIDNAAQMGAMLQALTGQWAKWNPNDFRMITAVNDKEVFGERLVQAFADAGINIQKDQLSQAIAGNVAPFLGILDNGARAQVYTDITRSNAIRKMEEIAAEVELTGLPPSPGAKGEFVDSYIKALFAHRGLRIAKRRSGQLLQQWQRFVGEDQALPGSLWEVTGKQAEAELDQMATELIGATPAELVGEGTIPQRFVEAANKGGSGQLEMRELIDAAKVDGLDPLAGLDRKYDYREQARSYYKDSILFAGKTQVVANYLSQKVVFLAEGYKKAAGNGVLIRQGATLFHRDLLKDNLNGARAAAEAYMRADVHIRQSWSESIRKGFFESNTPFAGNPDAFGASTGSIPLATQYEIAQKVLEEPWDAKRFPIQLRDKLQVSLKLLANRKLEQALSKAYGSEVKLPVTPALQMLGAVDQRAGLRVYMTDRANDFFIKSFWEGPDWTWPERRAYVDKKLQDVLYSSNPSAEQVSSFRKQHKLGEEISNDEIAAYIASEKIGVPVLTEPENMKSWEFAQYSRMQNKPTGVGAIGDQMMRPFRKNDYGDMIVSFWRSPWNQMFWDMSFGAPPIINTAKVINNIRLEKEVPPELLAATQAGWITFGSMLAMFAALDSEVGKLTGSAPLDANERREWLMHNKPNSVFGIPYNLGGIPVLNTLFLWKDLKDKFASGNYSDQDKQNAWWNLMQVGTGQVMRQTGFRSLQMLSDALTEQTPAAFQRLAAFIANGQLNPSSGIMRTAEGLMGMGADTVEFNRSPGSMDAYMIEEIGADDPLKQMLDGLQNFVRAGSPLMAAMTGGTLKETDWLGRNITPWNDWITRSEYPAGVPMDWNANNPVYSQLDRLGLLEPPTQLLQSRIWSVPMDNDAAKEYNHYLGTAVGGVYSQHPKYGGKTLYRVPAKVGFMVDDTYMEESQSIPADMTNLLDQATQGRTVYEAINFVLQHPEWKKWDANPMTTTDPRVKDMPAEAYREQPGPWLIDHIKQYYATLAEEQMNRSDSPYAQELRDMRAKRLDYKSIDAAELKATFAGP